MTELVKISDKRKRLAKVFVVSERDIRFFLSMNRESKWDERPYFRKHKSYEADFDTYHKRLYLAPYAEDNCWRFSLYSSVQLVGASPKFMKKWTIWDWNDDTECILYFKVVDP